MFVKRLLRLPRMGRSIKDVIISTNVKIWMMQLEAIIYVSNTMMPSNLKKIEIKSCKYYIYLIAIL